MDEMSRHAAGQHSVFVPQATRGVLKSLLENPTNHDEAFPKEPAEDQGKEGWVGEAGTPPRSAFLGPTLWEKTLCYDADLQLEYMDLEEFLQENGITAAATPHSQTDNRIPSSQHQPMTSSPSSSTHQSHASLRLQVPPPTTSSSVTEHSNGHAYTSTHSVSTDCLHRSTDRAGLHSCILHAPPSVVPPPSLCVSVGYGTDPAALLLSTVPGQETFNPRKHKLTPDQLKPQPMVKKARKVYMPDDMKDARYWARRRKNNMAAKRSRDARRLKENQIATRAAWLERENSELRGEVAGLHTEIGRSRRVMAKYQSMHGPL